MSNDAKMAVLKAGIVPEDTLPELRRWGLQVPEQVELETDPRRALAGIREAVESRATTEFRMTLLDAHKIYEENRKSGRLYYAFPDNTNGQKRTKTTFIEISYAITPSGYYLIPWVDEDINDLMLDVGTYLKPIGEERVRFFSVDSHYFGENKTFMVCRPSTGEDEEP